jgi:hypothetical protein
MFQAVGKTRLLSVISAARADNETAMHKACAGNPFMSQPHSGGKRMKSVIGLFHGTKVGL